VKALKTATTPSRQQNVCGDRQVFSSERDCVAVELKGTSISPHENAAQRGHIALIDIRVDLGQAHRKKGLAIQPSRSKNRLRSLIPVNVILSAATSSQEPTTSAPST
jgi:hypothetical protein